MFERRELPPPFTVTEGNSFVRLLTAKAIADRYKRKLDEVVAERWPHDLIMRAATAPALTTVPGWAMELAQIKVVTDGLAALGAASAGAQLMQRGLVLTFDGAGIISVPGFVASAANGGFVAEGQPIPVRQLQAAPAQLLPHKLASIGVLTREMMESSNAEQLIGNTLIQSAGLALDAVLFDSVTGNAVRPSGLRNGISALTPSSATDAHGAFLEDMATLMGATSAVGGPGPYALITSPGRAAALSIAFIREIANLVVLASPAVGNDIIVVALPALVSAGDNPEIETSTASTLHMNDAPLVLVNGGSPASPQRSMFQTESVALKMRWPLTWVLRDPRGVAWLTPAWKTPSK
jgi:hypothetical protein